MTLEQAAACCPQLAAGLKPSLPALPAGHRDLIAIADTRRLQHSLNLEAALSPTEPRMKQWDDALGWESHSRIPPSCLVEVHPANTGTPAEVIGKKQDAEAWLSRQVQRRHVPKPASARGRPRPRHQPHACWGAVELAVRAPTECGGLRSAATGESPDPSPPAQPPLATRRAWGGHGRRGRCLRCWRQRPSRRPPRR